MITCLPNFSCATLAFLHTNVFFVFQFLYNLARLVTKSCLRRADTSDKIVFNTEQIIILNNTQLVLLTALVLKDIFICGEYAKIPKPVIANVSWVLYWATRLVDDTSESLAVIFFSSSSVACTYENSFFLYHDTPLLLKQRMHANDFQLALKAVKLAKPQV